VGRRSYPSFSRGPSISVLGKYDKVEEYYKRAIDIYIKHYGNNDPSVAKTKNNLASAYLREGKYKLAAQLYQEVLSNEQGENPSNPVHTSSFSLRDGATVTTTLKNLGIYSSPSSSRRMKPICLAFC
jgi:tetratricopeptide (TPR) repeat protein